MLGLLCHLSLPFFFLLLEEVTPLLNYCFDLLNGKALLHQRLHDHLKHLVML